MKQSPSSLLSSSGKKPIKKYTEKKREKINIYIRHMYIRFEIYIYIYDYMHMLIIIVFFFYWPPENVKRFWRQTHEAKWGNTEQSVVNPCLFLYMYIYRYRGSKIEISNELLIAIGLKKVKPQKRHRSSRKTSLFGWPFDRNRLTAFWASTFWG